VGSTGRWNGVGWSGQPLLAVWSDAAKAAQTWMDGAAPRVEVISAGLDGVIRFIDGDTGRFTRPPLKAQDAPIKGTPALDPRFPVVYAGQGLQGRDGGWHFRAYSLLDFEPLMDIPGKQRTWNGDKLSPFRTWGASDSSALVVAERDLLLHVGENGLFYQVQLHGVGGWPGEEGEALGDTPLIRPEVQASAVRPGVPPEGSAVGAESSISMYGSVVYWADNAGTLFAFDLDRQQEVWRVALGDDTDASPAIAVEGGRPYIYIGSEVDKQIHSRPARARGMGRLHKIDASSGEIVWRFEVPAWTIRGKTALTDLNGGFIATVCMGVGPVSDRVFIVTSHEPELREGRLYALSREAGPDGSPTVLWSADLPGFAWASPITDGRTVVTGTSTGFLSGHDAADGRELWRLWMGGAVESSPVFWDDAIYVGTRGGAVHRVSAAPPGTEGPRERPGRDEDDGRDEDERPARERTRDADGRDDDEDDDERKRKKRRSRGRR
jgi:outer membrane protein assembly factor BamB